MPDTLRLHTRQQKHRRVSCEARVIRYDGPPDEWSSVNISAGGMFVTGETLLHPGAELEVGVWLPEDLGDAQEIVARARVVWINDPDTDEARPHVPPGMGMELIGLDDDDRAILRALLYGDSDYEMLEADELTEVGVEVGPYRILDLLGSGGMGEVYLAEHISLGRRVALKRLNYRLARDPRATRRFFEEGRLINRLDHDNILEIMDFISHDHEHYYVMELLEGDNLGDLLDDGPLPVERSLRIGAQLCDALQAVHNAGIVHRDIKPTNVLLVERHGTVDFVKLLDFGIAKLQGPDPERRPGVAVGTPAYMAPEQCLGEDPGPRADIYSLGALLFHMLTGHLVFEAETWSQMLVKQVNERPPRLITPAVPRRLEKLVMRCLRKSAWRRPSSAAAVAVELRAVLAELEPDPLPPARAPGPPRVAPVATVAAGTIAAAIAALATAALVQPKPAALPAPVVAPVMASPVAGEPESDAAPSLTPVTVPDAPAMDAEPKKRMHRLTNAQVTTLLRRAADHVRADNHRAAVAICHSILRDRPYSARAYRTLGIAHSHLHANRQACIAYHRYLSLAPEATDRNRVLEILEACR